MKKATQKLITALLIILILFNYIYGNYVPVYGAAEDVLESAINLLMNALGGVIGIFTWIPRLIAMGLGLAANILTAQVAYMDGVTAGADVSLAQRITITPFEIFFNKVQILDVNFLDTNVGGTTETIRIAVARWYYIVRLIAIAILLLILLYVGIRMAISSVASEKATYKRALIDWAVSLGLVFLLHYIIMFTVNINSAIVGALEVTTDTSKVSDAIAKIALTSLGGSWDAMAATVVYCMIVFQTLVFLVKYIKRMLTVGFLIIISPLISITYSIDKMGDQKAQALNTWLKEFVYNILIQPFHCVMYMAFVSVAFDLLVTPISLSGIASQLIDNQLASGVIAILCLKFVDDGEKIVRKIFGFGQASSLTPLETAAMVGAVTKGGQMAVGAAQNARKAINFAKEKGVIAAVQKDIHGLKNRAEITEKAQEYMKKDQNLKKGEALARAKNEAWEKSKAEKKATKGEKISKKAEKKQERRKSKIDKQMRKNLGEEQYAKLVAEQKTEKGKIAFEKARAEAAKQVDKSENRGKKIKGAVGNAWNSNTGKWVRKTMVPAGIGVALGAMTYGGTNLFTAIGTGKSMYQGAKEFTKTSTKTIANEAVNYTEGKDANYDELREHVLNVREKGDNGTYDAKSDETKDIMKQLESILIALGEGNRKDQIMSNISVELLKNPETFDLDSILRKAVGDKAENQDLQKAARDYADHKSDGYLYKQIENSESLNVSIDDFIDKIDKQIDYSMAETYKGSNNADNNDSSDNEQNSRTNDNISPAEKKEIKNVVENIQRTENVEEVINKVDDSDVSKLEYLVDQINVNLQSNMKEMRNLEGDAKTEMHLKITKLETARRLVEEKIKMHETEETN